MHEVCQFDYISLHTAHAHDMGGGRDPSTAVPARSARFIGGARAGAEHPTGTAPRAPILASFSPLGVSVCSDEFQFAE